MQPITAAMTRAERVSAADGAVVRLTIPAKAEYVTLCRLALAGLSRVRPLSEEELADLKLALTEACSNSVRHAYPDDNTGRVQITYALGPDRIAVEVVDDGAGFDPGVEGALDDDLGEGGLGIAIIKAISDEFELESSSGARGSRLRFVKRLSG